MNPYTVIRPFALPHCAEGEHETFDAVLDEKGRPTYDRDDNVIVRPSGSAPCTHTQNTYQPGQTVHLTDEQANYLTAAGTVAPAGADDVERRIVSAAYEALSSE